MLVQGPHIEKFIFPQSWLFETNILLMVWMCRFVLFSSSCSFSLLSNEYYAFMLCCLSLSRILRREKKISACEKQIFSWFRLWLRDLLHAITFSNRLLINSMRHNIMRFERERGSGSFFLFTFDKIYILLKQFLRFGKKILLTQKRCLQINGKLFYINSIRMLLCIAYFKY